MRVAAALQLAAVLIVYGAGTTTNLTWLTSGLSLITVAEVPGQLNLVVVVLRRLGWGNTRAKNTQLLALELTVAHARNVIFGGIHFWLNGCQTTAVQINLAQLRPLAFVPAMV